MRCFIYLDTDILNSYIAQIYDELIQTQETETQSSNTIGNVSSTEDIPAFAQIGMGINEVMLSIFYTAFKPEYCSSYCNILRIN